MNSTEIQRYTAKVSALLGGQQRNHETFVTPSNYYIVVNELDQPEEFCTWLIDNNLIAFYVLEDDKTYHVNDTIDFTNRPTLQVMSNMLGNFIVVQNLFSSAPEFVTCSRGYVVTILSADVFEV